MGSRSISPRPLALAIIARVMLELSFTGLVFAIGRQVVTPPATAVSLPLMTSSLYSSPGSLKCTCISMSPGITSLPAASMTQSAAGHSRVIFEILSPSIRTFASSLPPQLTIVPFFIKIFIVRSCLNLSYEVSPFASPRRFLPDLIRSYSADRRLRRS